MKNQVHVVFAFILCIVVLVACKTTPPTITAPDITVVAPSPTVDENGYPAPTNFSAYPAPTGGAELPPVTKVPPTSIPQTPDPNLALVKGRLLLLDQPVSEAILYLADVISSETGGQMVRFDRSTPTRTVTDEDGDFLFLNVPPGKYGVVIDRVIDSYLLLTPEGDSLILTITGNEQIDLGELNYEDLPIPQDQ